MPASVGCGGDVEIESTGQLRPYADQAKRRLDSSQLALGVRQDVADEWAARLGDTTQDTLRYPLRYLDTLIARAVAGDFTPELGVRVKEARQGKLRRDQLMAGFTKPANSGSQGMSAVSDAVVSDSEIKRQSLAKLAELSRTYRSPVLAKGGGTTTTPAQNHAAVQGGGPSTTPAQNHAAVQGGGPSTTPPPAKKPFLLARLKTQ